MTNFGIALPIALLCFLTFLNSWLILVFRWTQPLDAGRKTYSWEGDDRPFTLPINMPQTFEHTYTENIQYFGLGADVQADVAWQSLRPPNNGMLRLGPNQRPFGISLIHEIHCLQELRHVIQTEQPSSRNMHIAHCLNYLLQGVLCSSDLTLEPVEERAFQMPQRQGITTELSSNASHICRDWTRVYKYMEDQYWRNSDGNNML